MMKPIVYILALSALIAASYSAPTSAKEEKVIFTDGKKGPNDYPIASYTVTRLPSTWLIRVVTGAPSEEIWDYSKENAHITYIEIVQVGSTKATASITSGGVGTNHLTFKAVPYNGGGFEYNVDVWGYLSE